MKTVSGCFELSRTKGDHGAPRSATTCAAGGHAAVTPTPVVMLRLPAMLNHLGDIGTVRLAAVAALNIDGAGVAPNNC